MSQQIPPTRMNLTMFKAKHGAAKKGYELLKKKSDALKVRFREICKNIHATKCNMGTFSSDAYFSLSAAEYAAGNFRSKLLQGQITATVRVSSRTDNIAGVKLPVFTQREVVPGDVDSSENLGLVGGGRKIATCRENFSAYIGALIKLASLQTSFVVMDEALKVTNRRVNALENVTIPRIVKILADINRELDELEREDFTRLKKVQGKKEERQKLEEKERLERAAREEGNKTEKAKKKKANKALPATQNENQDVLEGYDIADDEEVFFK
jgi:V-type H+-transporting ATPase subunit D